MPQDSYYNYKLWTTCPKCGKEYDIPNQYICRYLYRILVPMKKPFDNKPYQPNNRYRGKSRYYQERKSREEREGEGD